MARMADLTGHTSRVLHMAVSPDGNTVRPSIHPSRFRYGRFALQRVLQRTATRGRV